MAHPVLGLNLDNIVFFKVHHRKDKNGNSIYKIKFLSSIDGVVKNVTNRIGFATNLKIEKYYNAVYKGYWSNLENEIRELFPGIKIGDRLE